MISKTIKYIVYPDWVTSQHDGDRHFIGLHQLIRLYRVNPSECIDGASSRVCGINSEDFKRLIELKPRHDGNYALPTK